MVLNYWNGCLVQVSHTENSAITERANFFSVASSTPSRALAVCVNHTFFYEGIPKSTSENWNKSKTIQIR